tara:strand:- start:5322 stop:6713 length:1392 start_codon:yes stop_codon:yes gene_type:complete
MNFKYLDRIIFNENTSLKDVLKRFNETAVHTEKKGFGIIINNEKECIAVVSDGDIRSKILQGISIEEPIKSVANYNFVYVFENDDYHNILRQFDKDVSNLPLLNKNKQIIDLYQYSKFIASARNEPKIIRARAPVRISFSGGGTDFSQYINHSPSFILSSTINKYCTSSVIVRNDNEIHIYSKDLNKEYVAKNIDNIAFGDDLDLIKAAIKIMKPNFGIDLEVLAEFDRGSGLGGSSSVAVSVIGALNHFRNENHLDTYNIADLAYQVERIDLGIKGGWQDQYATSFGGFSYIEFRENKVLVNPLKINRNIILELEYNLMLFRIGGVRNSGKIQKNHIKSIKSNEEKFIEYSNKMSNLTITMKEYLLKGNLKKFGDLLNESWNIKKKMNSTISNHFIEDCYNTAIKIGALGGKLLGAGESGYLLLYASPLYQRQIKLELESKGAMQEYFKFSDHGLEVWSTKK